MPKAETKIDWDKPIQTNSGQPTKLLELRNDIAWIVYRISLGSWYTCAVWMDTGKPLKYESALFHIENVPEKRTFEGWCVVIFSSGNPRFFPGPVEEARRAAQPGADYAGTKIVACLELGPIEYTVGQGLEDDDE